MIIGRDLTDLKKDELTEVVNSMTEAVIEVCKKHNIAGSGGQYNLYRACQDAVRTEYEQGKLREKITRKQERENY